jgi:hypothetical protein
MADSVNIVAMVSMVAVTMANLRDAEHPTRSILPIVVVIMAHRSASMVDTVSVVIMDRVSLDAALADAVLVHTADTADSNAAMPATAISLAA